MAPIESLMEHLRKSLITPEVSIFFNDVLESLPKGWPANDHSMDKLLSSREDSITVQGFSEPGDFKNKLVGMTSTFLLEVRKTIAILKISKAIRFVDGIANQIDTWDEEIRNGKDQSIIAVLSQSAEVDRILADGMEDATQLLITCKEKYKTFQQCRRDGLATLKMGIQDIQQKIAPQSTGTKNSHESQDASIPMPPAAVSKPTFSEEFFTTQQLCEKLKVTERCVANWRASGKISFSKIGRKIIYSSNQVDELLAKHYRRRRPW